MSGPPANPLRIGVLGAARITDEVLVRPARDGLVRLSALAARDRSRAQAQADTYGFERVVDSYEELLADPNLDAIYNPLPNGLHAEWNLRALRAGKHVLTEKPFAANATEAGLVREAAAALPGVLFHGLHYRYHPVFARLLELTTSGALGRLQEVDVVMRMPAPPSTDIRWSYALAGGALMDLGCYAVHVLQSVATLTGGRAQVTASQIERSEHDPEIDGWCRAELALPDDVTGRLFCSMVDPGWELSITARGSRAGARVANFIKVSTDDRLIRLGLDGEPVGEEHLGTRSSYHYQLDAFTAAVRQGAPVLTDAADAVANAGLVDDCYRLAGLPLRPARLTD